MALLRSYMGVPFEVGLARLNERFDRFAEAARHNASATVADGTRAGLDQLSARVDTLAALISEREPVAPPSATADPFPLDLAPANSFDWDGADIESLWDHVSATWAYLGREDPFYSVATSDDFHLAEFEKNAARFFASSQHDLERIDRWFERHSRALPVAGTVVEYGCGVGRSTPSLARKFAHVKAFDISKPHMEIAREIVRKTGLYNVQFVQVSTIDSLDEMNTCDLFYSCIVLQHNPPPLIAEILRRALAALNPGGFAFFQVPTYAKDYKFDLKQYVENLVNDASNEKRMELHPLPQEAVFKIIAEQGCSVLEVQPDYCLGLYETWISNTFFVEKRT